MKKIAGTIQMTAQCGQNCAIATHVDMTTPACEPRYGTKLISPAAMPIRSPCLSPNSVGAFAVAGARLRGRGSFKTGLAEVGFLPAVRNRPKGNRSKHRCCPRALNGHRTHRDDAKGSTDFSDHGNFLTPAAARSRPSSHTIGHPEP